MKRKLLYIFCIGLFAMLFSTGTSALTINGQNYDKTYYVIHANDGFTNETINGVNAVNYDDGHTANLIGGIKAISATGYFYNTVLGYDTSVNKGAAGYVNGTTAGQIKVTQSQLNTVNGIAGFRGKTTSSYRGFSQMIDEKYYPSKFVAGKTRMAAFYTLPTNYISVSIKGDIDSADKKASRVQIIGKGLPNKTSYGKTRTYSNSSDFLISDGIAPFGTYYMSAYIANAGKYDITYTVEYRQGSKYQNQGNAITTETYEGSGNFSTKEYYVESNGRLWVTINVNKKPPSGTVTVDLRKGTGVTTSYDGKQFGLYSGSTLKYTATTNTSGYAYFYNVPYGSYTLNPITNVTSCYYDPSSTAVNLNSSSLTKIFTLYRSTGTLKVVYDTEDSLNRQGASFQISNATGKIADLTTNSAGTASYELKPGNYSLKQISAHVDYIMDGATHSFTIQRGATTTITIYNKAKHNLTIEYVPPNADYPAGYEVVSTFRVKNASRLNLIPTDKVKVQFKAYDGVKQIISTMTADNVIIPANGDNLIWFKWIVPSNLAGKTVTLEASVNADSAVSEINTSDNKAVVSRVIVSLPSSDTPNTQYEANMPDGFTAPTPPNRAQEASKTWAVWEWENDWFVKKTYGVQVISPTIQPVPDSNAPSREWVNGYWQMRSGYAFSFNFTPSVSAASLYPKTDMITAVQYAAAYYPEYQYSMAEGKYTALSRNGNNFKLSKHYTPLWYPNKDYTVQIGISQLWTPAGMVYGYANCQPIKIVGSVYDDWYNGR